MNKILFLIMILCTSTSLLANNKMVVGKDDRIQIDKRNKNLVHESIGLIFYKNGDYTYQCTGTIIAPKVVLTAAHCIEPLTDIYFIPGQTSRIWSSLNHRTKNAVKAKTARQFPGYHQRSDALKTDIGILIFEEELKATPLPLNTRYETNERVTIAGYPDDKKTGTLWQDQGFLDGASYTIDTFGGQSGSALVNDDNEIIGVHSYANYRNRKNYACLLTQEHIEFIQEFTDLNY